MKTLLSTPSATEAAFELRHDGGGMEDERLNNGEDNVESGSRTGSYDLLQGKESLLVL